MYTQLSVYIDWFYVYVGYCVYVVECMHRPNVYVAECIHRLILYRVTMSQEFEAKESHLVDTASACLRIYVCMCMCNNS